MQIIKDIIESIKNILGYISTDPAEIEAFVSFLGFFLTGLMLLGSIICFVDGKIVALSNRPKNKAKRLLKEYNQHIYTLIKKESVFFNDDDPKKFLFYRYVPIKKYHLGQNIHLTKLIFSSYFLLGEAGSGKSSIIKRDYLYQSNKFTNFWRINTGLVYINQQLLGNSIKDMSKLEDILDCVRCTQYKKIILYIDGFDEFGEEKVDKIFESMTPLSKQIKKVKITCRTNFAVHNIINHRNMGFFGFKEKQRYVVSNWQQPNLVGYSSFLLKHLHIEKVARKRIIDRIKNESQSRDWSDYINSPLLLKFYLYLLIHGDQNKSIEVINKYEFYSDFVTEIISTQRKREGNYQNSHIQNDLDNISGEVFKAFSNNYKHIPYANSIKAILKAPSDNYSYFTHDTFFEYFVARYYLRQVSMNPPTNSAVAVLQQTYTNDYADFITAALNGTSVELQNNRKQVVETLLSIYYFTLSSDVKHKYSSFFPSVCYSTNLSTQIRQAVQQLDEYQFFTLKYEIIFRLGRMDITSKDVVSFLNAVYNYDGNINIKENSEYYTAVLKRCCAISSSFLGSEQIELDYVKKMLPRNKLGVNDSYISNYDLANRSHTLLFYGDITKADIFSFKDDATNNPFSLAFSKRIERLRLDLPEQVNSMDNKQKKKYYFRVFDLATIYTFMFDRKRVLTDEEYRIVSRTRVHFVGASEERNELMNDMLTIMLELNDNLKAIC